MSASKIITGTILGAGAIAGYSYYLRMKRTGAELQVIPKASIYQVNWDGITIRLDVTLKNPTKGSFSMKFPFIKLVYKETLVGSSQVVNNDIRIPAFGEVRIDNILVKIPILSIFSVSSGILKAVQNTEQIKLTASMVTTIDLGLVKLPFEESHEVLLKK